MDDTMKNYSCENCGERCLFKSMSDCLPMFCPFDSSICHWRDVEDASEASKKSQ